MSTIVRANELYKFHGPAGRQATILKGVSFQVREGEFACVMGPSGSGKSTLLHLLAGLDDPSSGHVELAGRPVHELHPKERTLLRRQAVGFVFQFFNLLPNLTVRENVGLPLSIQGQRPAEQREHVAGLLERFGIAERAEALPHQLSGGEMQRTSIARALAGGQPLLFCDEPTGNLSQKHGLEVMRALRGLCDEDGKSVLLVTHNPRDAAFADRVLFLVDGELDDRVVLEGPDIPVERVHEALAELHI